jgi:hypothetical protein
VRSPASFREGERLVAFRTATGRNIACNSIWEALPWQAVSGLAASLCDVDDRGLVIVNAGGQTSRPGVGRSATPATRSPALPRYGQPSVKTSDP